MAEAALNKRFGPYLIQNKLGTGGVATVYKAVDQRSAKTVALKILQSTWSDDSDVAQRFRKEAEIVKALQHPNIVAIYDYGVVKGRAFLVMQYMAGGSLAQRFEEPATISSQEVVRLLRRIASALDHAHRRDVIHRDLKLENILLDERGEAALSDFGIARVKDNQRLTMTGSIVGTPLYMSPEQARGQKRIDYRADLYSLAIVSYLLTIGRFPFGGPDLLTVLSQHVSAPPPPPSQIAPDLPPALDIIMLKGMAKKPEDRYPSADAFIEAYARVMCDSAPRQTLVNLCCAAAITETTSETAITNPWEEAEPEASADDLVEAAKSTDDREEAIAYLKRALNIDPWHAQANRMLHRLEEVKPIAQRAVVVTTPDTSEPLPEFERKIRRTSQDKRKERRRTWSRIGCVGALLMSFAFTIFALGAIQVLPGVFTTISTILGGPTPVKEIDGVPIEEIPDAAVVVPPSQSEDVGERDADVLEEGYNHEYTFWGQAGEYVAIYVQFLSLSANQVSRNVAILDPNDNNYVDTCETDSILKGGDSNITFICQINMTGTWKVHVFGRQGESTGVYFVGVEHMDSW